MVVRKKRPLSEYLTCWGPGLLRLGAIMSFWWLLRFEAGVIAFGSRGWLGSFHHAKDVW